MNDRRVTIQDRIMPALVLAMFVFSQPVQAQISASDLAELLERAYEERIRNINEIEISSIAVSGMFEGLESTSRYEKVNRDGRYILIEAGEESVHDGMLQGIADDLVAGMVRHASEISEENHEGHPVYRVEIEDREYLAEIQTAELPAGELDEEFMMDAATLYIDREDLVIRQSSFYQHGENGGSLAIHFVLDDYRTYSGLPVPHIMRMQMEGIDQMISEEELAQARAAMREMEIQLESMPEAQRNMIESQLRPQMERFESMIEQGNLGNMEIQITSVEVN